MFFTFRLDTKDIQQKYQDVIMDFSYFKISDDQEKKINANVVSFDATCIINLLTKISFLISFII